MGVRYYGPGDHKAGFIGFRATRIWGENNCQEYFSTRKAEKQDDSDWHFRYQRIKALHTDTKWEMESLWYQYQQFVTTNHSRTHPLRGVGVYSLMINFARWNKTELEPCIQVSVTGKNDAPSFKRFFLRHYDFSKAWELAVNLWAEEHEILEEDRVRVMANPPAPEQFKELRRHLNENEGYDISVATLGHVFREQREARQHQRIAEQAHLHKRDQPRPSTTDCQPADIERDMLAWFDQANTA